MSYLIQILLPLADNDGTPFPAALLHEIQEELAGRFGGLTAYSRGPAEGTWAGQGRECTDDIIVVEVMVNAVDEAWWSVFRHKLEHLLRQEVVVIRAQEIRML